MPSRTDRSARWCKNDDGMPVHAHGLCQSCYRYWKRTGRERPEQLIVRHGQRQLEREIEKRLARGA